MTSYTFYPISTLTLDGITQCKIYNTSSVVQLCFISFSRYFVYCKWYTI